MKIQAFVPAMVATAVLFVTACRNDRDADPPADKPVTVRQQLQLMLEGNIPTGELQVEYNDMHAFHGGKTLLVKGDTLRARFLLGEGTGRRQVEPPPVSLTADQMHGLVSVLLEIEAWDQRVPECEAVPDESRAGLSISIGTTESRIWEWYNDLGGNNRIVRVKQLLEEIAGPYPGTSTAPES